MVEQAPIWTPYELSILKEKFEIGYSDRRIHEECLPARSRKAIQSKRRSMNYVDKTVPHRPTTEEAAGKRRFTIEDDKTIMLRYNGNESFEAIASDYGITAGEMEAKIDKLLESKHVAPLRAQKKESTKRLCLWCSKWFFSTLPKSTNRRCDECKTNRRDNGPSFLDAYS